MIPHVRDSGGWLGLEHSGALSVAEDGALPLLPKWCSRLLPLFSQVLTVFLEGCVDLP